MDRDPVRDDDRERIGKEWEQQGAPADGAVEFEVNRRTIGRHLPEGGRVLDIGGGEGRYTIWLAGRGNRVLLADSSPAQLDAARGGIARMGVGANVEDVVEADVRDLSRWPDASFDAVLCLGPFHHLPNAEDRERAAAEIARVLRPGGVAFVALMPRYSFLRRMIAGKNEGRGAAGMEPVAHAPNGENPGNDEPAGAAHDYGVEPDEVVPFFERHGFASIDLLASEGIATGIEKELGELAHEDPAAYERAIDLVMESANDPSILGMSGHLLYVGRREGIAAAATNLMEKSMEMTGPAGVTTVIGGRYGAVELKRVYNRNLLIALGISVALHGAIIGYYALGGDDQPLPRKITLADLPHPDTSWSIPITLSKPQGGGGSPDSDKPLGHASKGSPNATPDRTKDNVDKSRSVIIKSPDKIRVVEKEPTSPKVTGDISDTSKKTNVTGTKGQSPNGIGSKPAGGSGGPGVGIDVGAATGLGSRGWVVRPHAVYPGGLNATGTVMLRFTVLPNGDIANITPIKRADQDLVNAAIAGLRRAKARPLPDNVPQIAQVATIPFTFELR